MLALPPTTQPALPLLSTIARLLSSERAFAARMQDLFVLLHEAVGFHDGRLVCWLRSAQSAGPREQFYTLSGWHDFWIDDLTDLVHDVLVHQVATYLGVEPEVVDPELGDLGED